VPRGGRRRHGADPGQRHRPDLGTATRPGLAQRKRAGSARHGIRTGIETFPLEKADDAYARMIEGKARFRAVRVAED
jgi:hypothetical protein